MYGNVLEWCSDWHADDFYRHSPRFDPQCYEGSGIREERGGGFGHLAFQCRSAGRWRNTGPTRAERWDGFRVVLEVADEGDGAARQSPVPIPTSAFTTPHKQ